MRKIPHDPTELIAVVDRKDRIVGKSTRLECHKTGMLHRTTALIIRNEENEILLQTRADDGRLDYSAGGHVGLNKTRREGAMIEAFEELGIGIPAIKFKRIGKWVAAGNSIHLVTVFEVFGDYSIEDFDIDKSEVKGIQYYSIDKIKKLLRTENGVCSAGFGYSMRRYLGIRGFWYQ